MYNSEKSQAAVRRTEGLGCVAGGEVRGVAGVGVLTETAVPDKRVREEEGSKRPLGSETEDLRTDGA